IILSVAIMIGMAKTGIHGTGMIAVPMLALVFGGKSSSGIMLIILSFADIFALLYYHRHADRKHLIKLLPWAVAGVMIGTWTGHYIDDAQFRLIMGIIIFTSLVLMIWLEKINYQTLPQGIWFAALMGILGGFTTMVGNLAGSVMAIYLLTMKLPKNQYIGTAVWFFAIINLIKIPFHIFVWGTITWHSFLLDLTLLPFIAIGSVIGFTIVKRIPDTKYRWFIITMTIIAALAMII
ncbi:MAG: sulfite exporter TauE/SafE family protein, partial [Cyclobacteriaceae bacterium]